MHNDIEKILADKNKIEEMLTKTANRINVDYMVEELVAVPILCGSMIFAADLVRRLNMPLSIECMKASSYRNSAVSGELMLTLDIERDMAGKNILIIEDIIDTGRTLHRIKNLLLERGAKSVRICTLLDKPARRAVDISADYVGMEIPDEFVVGYGLDYNEKYRNLPYIGILKREIYE